MNKQNIRTGILTGGTWCADHNRLVERWPEEDGLVQILSEDIRGGGSACNLAIDIKRLDPDLAVATIGLVGGDEDGRILLKQAAGRNRRQEENAKRQAGITATDIVLAITEFLRDAKVVSAYLEFFGEGVVD